MIEINIGVIGANLTAYVHLESIKTIIQSKILSGKAKITLKALCSLDNYDLNDYGKDFKIPKLYKDYHELIDDQTINTIFITGIPALHKEIYLYAAKAKKNIFCEKQVALKISDIEEMIQARDENHILSQIGFVLRTFPIFWFTKNVLETEQNKKLFGKLQNIIIREDLMRPLVEINKNDGQDENYSSGILFEHSINDIDLLRFFFGEVKDVFAKIKYFNDGVKSEDSVAVTLDLINGPTAQLTSIWHNMKRDERIIEIFFENTFIKITFNWEDGKLVLTEKDGLSQTFDPLDIDDSFRKAIGFEDLYPFTSGGFGYEVLLFFKRIIEKDWQNKSYLTASLEDGLLANKIIKSCYESSRDNKRIDL